MFTGLIQEVGILKKISNKNSKKYFEINCSSPQKDELKIGDSVACNGICLTVIAFTEKTILVESMKETLSKTTAKNWKINDKINLEQALRYNGRLDGHLVQGHVDCVGNVLYVKKIKDTTYLRLKFPSTFLKFIVNHGSIAINGISLTIASANHNTVDVALISHTLEETNLKSIKSGNQVNLEFDIIGKYINKNLDNYRQF